MRLNLVALKALALIMVAGCSPGALSMGAPQSTAADSSVHGVPAPVSAMRGIYVGLGLAAAENTILGYAPNNQKNKPPICTENPGTGTGDVSVDRKGNLMVATLGGEEVEIFAGPAMCGARLGAIYTNGLPYDAASDDAANGKVVAGNLYANSGFGNVVVCTLAGGCATTLANHALTAAIGIAVARNGDCWASGDGFSTATVLIYFKHCSGSGQVATGFRNEYPGGLDIDKDGNLVSIDAAKGFWIYKGCKPDCTVVGGPFAYEGTTLFGHLNKDSTKFAAADEQYGQIDVYRYAPTGMTYEYSFNNGMTYDDSVTAAAFNPRSKE